MDVAAVETQFAYLQSLAPFVEEALGVCADFAVLVNYAVHGDSVCCGSLLVLDKEAAGLLRTVAYDALDVDVTAVEAVGDVQASEDDWHRSVRGAFAVDLEALGGVETLCEVCTDGVRGAFHLEEHVCTVGYALCEGCGGRDHGKTVRVRHGPSHHLAAVRAGEVEHQIILGGRGEARDAGRTGSYVLGRELICLSLFRSVDAVFDAVHLRVWSPGEADAVRISACQFHIEVGLDCEGLDAFSIYCPFGGVLAAVPGLDAEPVFHIHVETLGDRDICRIDFFFEDGFGHCLVGVYLEEIGLCVLGDIPAEGHVLALAYLGAEVQRLQTPRKGDVGYLLELVGAGGCHPECQSSRKQRRNNSI